MRTVWKGTFEQVGTGKEKVFTVDLTGLDPKSVREVINDYIECKEESGWAFISSTEETTK